VCMYEYFGVGLEIREEVASIFPRFLRWLPKHHLSAPSRRSLEIWRLSLLFLSSFMTFQMNLNPWVGCEGYAECERALELNDRQVLIECGHGKYWYLGDRVLPQVEHEYPPTTIPAPSCHIVLLADFLADEEIARAHDGYIVAGVEGEEGGEGEEEIPYPYHVDGSSSSIMETYDVMNPDGTYSSMPLTRPKHVPNVPWPDSVDVDLVEESMRMIGGLQSLVRTQSSQYVLNNAS
ncbi:hypothetical protein SO802_026381, partial [Lithocarpus litseifolius]